MSPMIKLPLTVECALLGFLRERPVHAYEMHQQMQQAEALGLVWHLKQSQLYALLTKLEEAGYIAADLEPQANRPPRKMLSLTEQGRVFFDQWRSTPVEHGRDFRIEFLAKLYFARQAGSGAVAQLLATQREACLGWLGALRDQSAALDEGSFEWLVVRFRLGQIEATLVWLDTCSSALAPAALC